jgi:hypothetical protein
MKDISMLIVGRQRRRSGGVEGGIASGRLGKIIEDSSDPSGSRGNLRLAVPVEVVAA